MVISTLKKSFQLSTLATALALAGCGGGGNDTIPPKITPSSSLITVSNGGNSSSSNTSSGSVDIGAYNVKKVLITGTTSEFYMNAGTTIEVVVHALDSNNMGVAEAPVTLQISNPELTGVYSNTSQNLATDEKGQATVTLEVKNLTSEQKQYLKDNGLEVIATINGISSKKILKGTDAQTSTPTSDIAVKSLLLEPSSKEIKLEKGYIVNVIALALDKDNNIIPNTTINFSINNPVDTGVSANSVLTVTTNEKGEATLELEVKSLTEAQINQLKTTGLTVTAEAKSGVQQSITLKGVEPPNESNINKAHTLLLSSSQPNFEMIVGNKITVVASVTDNKQGALSGVPVTFTLPDDANKTGIVNLTGSTVITNEKGEATIELEIKSIINKEILKSFIIKSEIPNTTKSSSLELKGKEVVALAVENVALTSNVANIPMQIGEKFTVTAFVTDKDNGDIANIPVTFTLPSSEVSGIANLSGSTVTTNEKGEATLQLEVKSLTEAQKTALRNGFIINATANNKPAKPLTMKLSEVNSVTLSSNVSNIIEAVGTKFEVTAFVADKNNGGIANIPVTFTLPSPEVSGIANLSGSTVTTNEKGEATLQLEVKSLTEAQKTALKNGFEINAIASNKPAPKLVLPINSTVIEKNIDSLLLTANSNQIIMRQGAKVQVVANVLNQSKAGISGIPVKFELQNDPNLTGVFNITGSTINTDAKGEAIIELEAKALTNEQKQYLLNNGVTVKATTTNGKTQSIRINAVKEAVISDIAKVSLVTSVNNLDLNASLGSKIKVTALIEDNQGNRLANLPVNFRLDDSNSTGIFANTPLNNVTTNENGEAELELEVKSLTEAQKYYLQTGGVTITAQAGSIDKSLTLRTKEAISANSARTILLLPEFDNIKMAVGEKVKVTAIVLDKDDNRLSNAPVVFKLDSAGTGLYKKTTSPIINTNAQGEAVIELEIQSLTEAQKAKLEQGVEIQAISGATAIGTTIIRGATSNKNTDAYELFVSQSKETLSTGADEMDLSIRVMDTDGGIKANAPVYLQIEDAGKYGLRFDKTSNLQTDENGLVNVRLIQEDISLLSKLNHKAKITVIVDDGNFKAKQSTLEIDVIGTTVKDVSSSKTLINPNDTFNVSGKLLNGKSVAITNAPIELINNGQPTGIKTFTDNVGQFTFNNIVANQLQANADGNLNLSLQVKSGEAEQTFENVLQLQTPNSQVISIEYGNNNTKDFVIKTVQEVTVNVPQAQNGDIVYLSTNKGFASNTNIIGNLSRVATSVNNGKATFYIQSDITGIGTLTVEYNDERKQDNISFVTTNPVKLSLQPERKTINTNSSTRIIAKVLDANDNPVKNAIVTFVHSQDASGGNLSSSVAITDASGVASIVYNSGISPTQNDGVEISARVSSIRINGTETPITTALQDSRHLTVQSPATFIGLGIADKLEPTSDQVYYLRKASVYVIDNIGQPAKNQPVSIAVIANSYSKGLYNVFTTSTNEKVWSKTAVTCHSEDSNLNGNLDNGEDKNQNGILDPRNAVTILDENNNGFNSATTMVTDASGKLNFTIRYPKDHAEWFTANMRVSTTVNGSEHVQTRLLNFPVAVSDVSLGDNPIRPNQFSPFGQNLATDSQGFCTGQ